ncbi:MAG: hypothetical protein KDA61_13805 [Planctomycetales bacterium]|nr:hypothetical protein [Planctomycetales bacterium]
MQAGRIVGDKLQRALEEVRNRLDGHASEMHDLDQRMQELLARRGDAFLDLAKHYLPNVDEESIANAFVEVRDDLLEVLARKQRRQREIESQIEADDREILRLNVELERVTERLNQKVAEREELEKVVAERLHGSDEFRNLSQRAIEAEQKLEDNERRVAEIKSEASRKLPSYERSDLFQYLYNRGFGTAAYQEKGLTRRLDRWVARLISYPQARLGYEFLQRTPELMEQEVAQRRDKFNDLMEEVEAIEDQVSDELGLTEVMRQGQELGSARDQIVADVARRQSAVTLAHEELLKLERPENEFYDQAVARLQNFLANLRHQQLEKHSRATPEREDDAIVAEIGWLGEQLTGTDQQTASLRRDRESWDLRLGELQRLLQRFREAEFDSRRSEFDVQLDVDRLLNRFFGGELVAEQLWDELRAHQQFAPQWVESRDGPRILDSELSHVLGRVLIEVAGQTMRNAAYRGMQRRGPARQQKRQTTGRPPFRKRGFTNGRGF